MKFPKLYSRPQESYIVNEKLSLVWSKPHSCGVAECMACFYIVNMRQLAVLKVQALIFFHAQDETCNKTGNFPKRECNMYTQTINESVHCKTCLESTQPNTAHRSREMQHRVVSMRLKTFETRSILLQDQDLL